MTPSKHIIFLVFLPLIIWGVFLTFEDKLTPKPAIYQKHISVNEEIVEKYALLEKELNNFTLQTPDTFILKEIIRIKPPPAPEPKPKYIERSVQIRKPVQRNWKLKYIIITESKKIAFLNGKIVKVGDVIDGAAIIDIKPDCVEIKTEKGIKCIYLNQ